MYCCRAALCQDTKCNKSFPGCLTTQVEGVIDACLKRRELTLQPSPVLVHPGLDPGTRVSISLIQPFKNGCQYVHRVSPGRHKGSAEEKWGSVGELEARGCAEVIVETREVCGIGVVERHQGSAEVGSWKQPHWQG